MIHIFHELLVHAKGTHSRVSDHFAEGCGRIRLHLRTFGKTQEELTVILIMLFTSFKRLKFSFISSTMSSRTQALVSKFMKCRHVRVGQVASYSSKVDSAQIALQLKVFTVMTSYDTS